MPNIPIALWSTDTVGTVPAAMWLGQTILKRDLRNAYAENKQGTLDVILRVISGIHELAAGGDPSKPVWGDADHSSAIDELRAALEIPVPATGPGSWVLQLIVQELIRRLLELVAEEADAQ